MPRPFPRRGGSNMTERMWNTYRNPNDKNRVIFDRQQRSGTSFKERRVTFRNGRTIFNKGKACEIAIRTQLEEDQDMSGMMNNNSSGSGSKFRRRGSPIPRGGQGPRGKKKLIAGTSGWFLVTIPHGNKYDKEYILKTLLSIVSPRVFIPHYFKTDQTSISFHIDDLKMAEDLLNADRTIAMPDGFKMIIKVRNNIPHVQIDENLKQKMKMAMVKRYTATTKALDLTKFHADIDLRDIFCALFRPTIMLAAIDVIAENIPDLEALNLDDNRIHLMDHLKCLSTKLPHLKILHLANNRITTTIALDALIDCELVDLVLSGNPIKGRMIETVYVSEMRRKFPKLRRLDGEDLPPQIGFDVSDSSSVPPPVASFLCDLAGTDIVRQFLEQYFIIYDSDNRQPLLDAYHEHAMFSLTATYHSQPSTRLTPYLPHNRNVTRLRDLDARCRHLKNGRLPVVSFLSELPATQHDPQSFAVDLSLFTPQLLLLTVTGVFKEKSNDLLRSFQRVLMIVPSGSGFCIKNELMHVNNVTSIQIKMSFKTPAVTATVPIVATQSVSAAVHDLHSPASAAPDDATKLQMIQAMAQHSSMNLEWSKKCLEETNWNFERAGFVFTELHKQNKIPPEAFVK